MRTHFLVTLILLLSGAISAQVTKVDPLKLVKPSGTANRIFTTNGSGATAWAQVQDIVTAGTNIAISGNTISVSGLPTGSGSAGQVAFWNGSTVLSAQSNFTYNDATRLLTVGNYTIGSGIRVNGLVDFTAGGLVIPDGQSINGVVSNNDPVIGNGSSYNVLNLSSFPSNSGTQTGASSYNINARMTIASPTSLQVANAAFVSVTNNSNNVLQMYGLYGNITENAASSSLGNRSGLRFDTRKGASGIRHFAEGLTVNVEDQSSTGLWESGAGIVAGVVNAQSAVGASFVVSTLRGTSNTINGLNVQQTLGSGATATAWTGITIVSTNSGTLSGNYYGIRVVSAPSGANSWAFHNDQDIKFYQKGNLSVGGTDNPAKVTVFGSATIAGTYALIVTNATGTTSTAALVVQNNNTVGIGTNAPSAQLDVVGSLRFRTFGSANFLLGLSDANGNVTSFSAATVVTNGLGYRQGGNTFGATAVLGTNDAFSQTFIAGGKEFLLGNTAGNVSIGSNATPLQRASVFGTPSTVGTPFNDAGISLSGTWHNGSSSQNQTVEMIVDMLSATPTSEYLMQWAGASPFLKALTTRQLAFPAYTSAGAFTGTAVAGLAVTNTGLVITTSLPGSFVVSREVATYTTNVPTASGTLNSSWWVVPASLNGYKITAIGYSVATAGSGAGEYTVQVNRTTTGGSGSNFGGVTFVAGDKQKDATGLSFTLATGDLIRLSIGTADLATLPQGLTINYTIAP